MTVPWTNLLTVWRILALAAYVLALYLVLGLLGLVPFGQGG